MGSSRRFDVNAVLRINSIPALVRDKNKRIDQGPFFFSSVLVRVGRLPSLLLGRNALTVCRYQVQVSLKGIRVSIKGAGVCKRVRQVSVKGMRVSVKATCFRRRYRCL